MGKGNRLRQQRACLPSETYEPDEPQNWPDGHVQVALTDGDQSECIAVTIHGVRHHLHSTTAQVLDERLTEKIAEWDRYAKSLGAVGVVPSGANTSAGTESFDPEVIRSEIVDARAKTRDMVRGTLAMFGPRNELTEQHFPFLGFIERAQAFSLGAIAMVEAGNPLSAATLVRSFAENLASAFYLTEHPTEFAKLQPGAERGIRVGKIVAAAEKSLPGFKPMYDDLSAMAHPSGAGSFQTMKTKEDGSFTWQSHPTFTDVARARELLDLLDSMIALSTQVIQETARQFEAGYTSSDADPHP